MRDIEQDLLRFVDNPASGMPPNSMWRLRIFYRLVQLMKLGLGVPSVSEYTPSSEDDYGDAGFYSIFWNLNETDSVIYEINPEESLSVHSAENMDGNHWILLPYEDLPDDATVLIEELTVGSCFTEGANHE